ncbi:MAG: TlpA disulfide reductase family protein [Gammaproteobacteria bacterium]
MKHTQSIGLVIAILVAAGAAAFGVYSWMQPLHPQISSNGIASSSEPPAPAPSLSAAKALMLPMNDLHGEPHMLDDWRGKLLLVNFWATWCPPCREEMPLLVKLQAQYAAQGLQVVGIATDEQSEQDVRAFVKKMVVNYPILMSNNQSAEIVDALGGNFIGLPVSILLKPDGSVIKIQTGAMDPTEAESLVRTALKLPPLKRAPAVSTTTSID